jgi:hypothetical protein
VTAVTVQFGNSDDRLTQREWSELVAAVSRAVGAVDDAVLAAHALKRELGEVALNFHQYSFAWQLGDVELVPPGTFVPRAPATPVPDEFIIADDDVPRRFKT